VVKKKLESGGGFRSNKNAEKYTAIVRKSKLEYIEYGMMDSRVLCNISLRGAYIYPSGADILSN
jgi:hypothetical protein